VGVGSVVTGAYHRIGFFHIIFRVAVSARGVAMHNVHRSRAVSWTIFFQLWYHLWRLFYYLFLSSKWTRFSFSCAPSCYYCLYCCSFRIGHCASCCNRWLLLISLIIQAEWCCSCAKAVLHYILGLLKVAGVSLKFPVMIPTEKTR